MDVEYAILGGGVAGLAAAIRLTELGKQPLIIESGNYPSHKVCGEFFSPSCLALLNRWSIHPILLSHTQIYVGSEKIELPFPQPAGSLSHLTLDPLLAQRAVHQGAVLWMQTKVEDLKPAYHDAAMHQLILNSGETIKAKNLLIATGRLPTLSSHPPSIRYIGFKTHWSGIPENRHLEMFALPGSYLGLSPIENGKYNVACLATIRAVCEFSSPELFIENSIQQHPILKERLSSGNNLLGTWLQASIPGFGYKKVPHWPSSYFIGDAISTIPPACGGGIAFALASGYLAAEFAVKNNPVKFRKIWRHYSRRPLFFGKVLHHLFLNSRLSQWSLQLSQLWPQIPQSFYHLTRDHGVLKK